jgi:hypothetical protein
MILGALFVGATGALIGYFTASPTLMATAGGLGALIGVLLGWLGGRRYLLIVCGGVLAGAVLGYRSGDRDVLIMAAGSGGAIAGFIAAHAEQFLRKK